MPAIRVACYYRMSTDQQDESIGRQQLQVTAHCKARGYAVTAECQDDGITGSEVDGRAGLQEVLALARAKKIDGVVVDMQDRLVRLDLLEIGEFLSPLRRLGVWIEAVDKGRLDYNSMGGRLMIGMAAEVSREEQITKGRRSLTGYLRMAQQEGAPPLPRTPYGYRRDPIPGTREKAPPVPDGIRADVVRSIFRWYAAGHTVGWIVAELKRRNVPAPAGGSLWRRATIRLFLRNRAYIGDVAWGKTASGRFWRQRDGKPVKGDGTRKVERRPEEEWHVGVDRIPALIDRDLWASVQARLGRGDPSTPTASTDPGAFLLSRLLVCHRCGGWMTGLTRHAPYKPGVAYVCSTYVAHGPGACVRCEVREEWVVKQVIAELRAGLLHPENIDGFRDVLRERLREQRSDANLSRLRGEVKALEGRLSQARARLVEVSKDMVAEVEVAIRETREALKTAQAALRDAEGADPVRDLDRAVQAAVDATWQLETALQGDDRLLLKETLRGLLSKIVIDPEPYTTRSGKSWHRPAERPHIWVRPGSGLEVLVDLDASLPGTCSRSGR